MVFQYENELEKSAIRFLEKHDFLYSWQVPLYNRVIDLVAIDQEDNLIGIEFKLKDWKRALVQAMAHLNALDFVYVCLPGGSYLERLKRDAMESGIGVMIYDDDVGTVKIELRAEKSNRQWMPNVEYLRNYVKTRG